MKAHNEHIQKKVYENAKQLMYTHGVKGWNMGMLAAKSGMARNTLFKIVGSKEKLIELVVLSQIRDQAESTVDFIERHKDWHDKDAVIHTLSRAMEKFVKKMSLFEPIILPQVFKEYPAIESKVNNEVKHLSTLANSFFNRGKKTGVIRKNVDPEAFMDVAQSIVNYYIRKGVNTSLFEDRLRKIFEYMFRGVMS